MSEKDKLPGWPYFLAAIMVGLAYQICRELPDESEHAEFYFKPGPQTVGFDEDESLGLINSARAEQDDNHRQYSS